MNRSFICPVCNSKQSTLIEKVKRVFSFSIYKCIYCGLLFQYPIPTKTKLKNLYDQIYDKKCNLPLAEKAFEVRHESSDMEKFLEIKKYIKQGTLLDVGASTGFFIDYVNKQRGWIAHGIEYSLKSVEKAKKDFNIKLIHGEVTTAKTPLKEYDVITMYAVLDHIPDVDKHLSKIRKKLRKKGLFIINVQNSNSWEYVLYKMLHKNYAGFIFEHLYYFNKYTMSMILKKHGFRIIYITSRQFTPISLPPKRPLIGWVTFLPKLFLEYTSLGGRFLLGNTITVYAQKI